MSAPQTGKITAENIRSMKGRGKLASLTVYDYPMTRMLDEANVPLLLVGDSLGMVVLGYPNTTHVTMADMEHHVRACARANPKALLAADLPYRSYETPEAAVVNAQRLVTAGAEAVKMEGGRSVLAQVKAVLDAGIPVIGHLGMLPQHVLEEGGYKIKGKKEEEVQGLMADAEALSQAGVCAIVLELVLSPVAKALTERISAPTIGIGSGPDCDGQILVTHDLVGTFPWFTPRFVKPKLTTARDMQAAVHQWMAEMR